MFYYNNNYLWIALQSSCPYQVNNYKYLTYITFILGDASRFPNKSESKERLKLVRAN